MEINELEKKLQGEKVYPTCNTMIALIEQLPDEAQQEEHTSALLLNLQKVVSIYYRNNFKRREETFAQFKNISPEFYQKVVGYIQQATEIEVSKDQEITLQTAP